MEKDVSDVHAKEERSLHGCGTTEEASKEYIEVDDDKVGIDDVKSRWMVMNEE
jgi:hypothetical protein